MALYRLALETGYKLQGGCQRDPGEQFVEETGVDVTKPQASSAVDLEKNSILIAITDTGKVIYGGREIGPAGVRSIVKRLNQKDEMPVIIQADKTVPTSLLVRVIDEAKIGGAPSVNISTEN